MSYDSGSNYKYPKQKTVAVSDRYQVIGDWPKRWLPMNSIITVILKMNDGILLIEYTFPDGLNPPERTTWDSKESVNGTFDQYPYLFKKLPSNKP